MNDLEQLKSDIKEIKDALLGNEFNQNKGVVYDIAKTKIDIQNIENDIKKLQTFENELTIYIKQVKVFIGFLLAVITGLLIKIFSVK